MTDCKFCVFRFKDIEVREREFVLLRGGETISVEPKAFRVLVYLLRHPLRLVTKDEILTAIWGETAVSDNSLTRSIATLRRILGDDAREPQYIATVPTVGYRFLCQVKSTEDTSEKGNCPAVDPSSATPFPAIGPREGTGLPQGRSIIPKGWTIATAMVGTFLLLILVVSALRYRNSFTGRQIHAAVARTSKIRNVPLTNLPGAVWGPAFSPDGSQIVYVWDGENPNRGDLYLQQVGGAQPLRLTQSHNGFICCADWSPDGKQIAFSRCGDNGDEIMVISALGGPERKLTNSECPYWNAGRPIWTGKSLLLRDRCTPGSPPGLVLFSLETGTKKCLHDPQPGGLGDCDRAVSPDQQSVAFIGSASTFQNEIYTISMRGGPAKRITFDAKNITELMWSPDGEYLIFNSNRGGLPGVWRVAAAGGAVEPETVYPGIGALTRDGSRLAYVEPEPFFRMTSEIWRAELVGIGGPLKSLKPILDSSGGNDSPQPSPGNLEIAFSSYRTGSEEIWKSSPNGNQPMQLTSFAGHAGTPRWSPDGKWICFDYAAKAHSQIYVVDSDGRNAHAVTSGESENLVPSWSHDGAFIYLASNRTGNYQVWKLKLATGTIEQITYQGGFAALESYDSKVLYFSKFIGAGVWTVPVDGGAEKRITEAPHIGYWGHFAVTDSGIYLLDADVPASPIIVFYDFNSHKLKNVLRLQENALPWQANLAASRNGRTLFFAQGKHTSSISMAEYFH